MMNRLWIAGLVVLAACTSQLALAQGRDVSQTHVSVNLQDAELRTALTLLVKQTSADIIYVPTDKPYAKITLSLNDKPFESALEYICMAAGAQYEKKLDGVYVISPKSDKPLEVSKIERPGNDVIATASLPRIVAKILLKYANPKEVLSAITLSQFERYAAPVLNEQQFKAYNPQTTNPTSLLQTDPRTGQQTIINMPNSTNGPSTAPAVPMENGTANSENGSNRSPDPMASNGQRLGGPGGGGFGAGGTPGGGGTTGQATVNLIPDGVDSVQAYMGDNTLIVKGTDDGIEQLRKLIKLFDIAPKQVLIKVEFIETTTDLDKRFGIDYNFQRINTTAGTGFVPAGNVFLTYATGNLVAQLRTQLIQSNQRVVNSPIVTTMNNVAANIQFTTNYTYFVPNQIVTGNGQIINNTQQQTAQATTFLNVVPRINSDGTVTLFVNPQISTPNFPPNGSTGNQNFQTNSQSLTALRRVKAGETIVLGGLVTKKDVTTVDKIPILGDLPIIGSLFRNKITTRNDSELLIFVTPIVLDDPLGEDKKSVVP